MKHPVIAVYDANILYSAPMRDLFIRLAQAGLVHAKWTATIDDEWERHLLKNRPDLLKEKLAHTRELMNKAVRDCLVTGYEDLIDSLSLPDPDDRHVLAAAIGADAEVIVTLNLKHFPAQALNPFGIEAQHPDEFLLSLLDLNPAQVCATIKRQRENLRNPPKSAEEILEKFEILGLRQTVVRLRMLVGHL